MQSKLQVICVDEFAYQAQTQWRDEAGTRSHGSNLFPIQKMLIDSEEKGEPKPEMTLNLPPNFLDEYRRTYEYSKKYNM